MTGILELELEGITDKVFSDVMKFLEIQNRGRWLSSDGNCVEFINRCWKEEVCTRWQLTVGSGIVEHLAYIEAFTFPGRLKVALFPNPEKTLPQCFVEFMGMLHGQFMRGQSEPPTGDNGAKLNEDDQLRETLERLFPNPYTIEKTRKRLFDIIKLRKTSPNLTVEQLAGHFTISERIIQENLKMLRKHNLI